MKTARERERRSSAGGMQSSAIRMLPFGNLLQQIANHLPPEKPKSPKPLRDYGAGSRKISDDVICDIREAMGTCIEIAERFGVGYHYVCGIRAGNVRPHAKRGGWKPAESDNKEIS